MITTPNTLTPTKLAPMQRADKEHQLRKPESVFQNSGKQTPPIHTDKELAKIAGARDTIDKVKATSLDAQFQALNIAERLAFLTRHAQAAAGDRAFAGPARRAIFDAVIGAAAKLSQAAEALWVSDYGVIEIPAQAIDLAEDETHCRCGGRFRCAGSHVRGGFRIVHRRCSRCGRRGHARTRLRI